MARKAQFILASEARLSLLEITVSFLFYSSGPWGRRFIIILDFTESVAVTTQNFF